MNCNWTSLSILTAVSGMSNVKAHVMNCNWTSLSILTAVSGMSKIERLKPGNPCTPAIFIQVSSVDG